MPQNLRPFGRSLAAWTAALLMTLTAGWVGAETLEDPNSAPITTMQKYSYVPSEALPPVKGVSGYKWEDKTVVFPINLWIGWAPIIMANGGTEPSEDSVFFKRYGFKLKLPVIDDPVLARAAQAQTEGVINF